MPRVEGMGRGGTPLYGLYGDVPLDRVCFFFLPLRPKEGTYPSCESFLNRVYKSYLYILENKNLIQILVLV